MSTDTPKPARGRNNTVLWIIAGLLFLLLICGACTFLLLTPLADDFWRGFMEGARSVQ